MIDIKLNHDAKTFPESLGLKDEQIQTFLDILNDEITNAHEVKRGGLKSSEVVEILIDFFNSDKAKPPFPLVRIMLFLMQMGLEKMNNISHQAIEINDENIKDIKETLKELFGGKSEDNKQP